MSVEFERVKAIFLAAVEKATAEERAVYLDQACAGDAEMRRRVEALLRTADESVGFLDKPAVEMPGTAPFRPIPEAAGSKIGPYKLLQQLGEGGFGVVYMAEQQEPMRRKVALKIIKPGMDSKEVIARFESERQALALMDHPNIARVLDAGATESGQPFFVMELVRGVPITEFCDKNNLRTHQRLELFANVCHAVQHAHQKGIIHRDIKPSNIMVTLHDGKPVPKVIDFGVAKATNQQLTERTLFTAYGQMLGTPAYMSPEQAEMSGLDIDTRSDIYSLGVLLYELLAGVTPFDVKRLRAAGYAEMLRIIREEEPPRPSTRLSTMGDQQSVVASHRGTDVNRLRQLLRGDLDWIVMKALEKDRSRRYETANNFAADVERFLSNQAVEARPPSAAYKLRKFTERNKAAVLTAATVAAALVLATVISTWQSIRASHQRDRAVVAENLAQERLDAEQAARTDAETARQAEVEQRALAQKDRDHALAAQEQARDAEVYARAVYDFLRDLLGQAAPEKQPAVRTARGSDSPPHLLGQAAPEKQPDRNLRLLDLLDLAAQKIEDSFKGKPVVEAEIRQTFGDTYHSLGLYAKAESHLERAHELRRRELGAEHSETLTSLRNLVGIYQLQKKNEKAEGLLAQTEGLLAQTEDKPVVEAEIRQTVGDAYRGLGLYTEAQPHLERALELRLRELGEEHPDTLTSLNNLAVMYQMQGHYDKAESLLAKTLEVRIRVRGEEHPATLISMHNLASSYNFQKKYEQAESLYLKTIEIRRRVRGEDHPDTLLSMNNLAALYQAQEKHAQAEPLLLQALETERRVLGEEHPYTLSTTNNLAELYRAQRDYAKAEPLYIQTLSIRRRVFGEQHPSTLTSMFNLAGMYQDQGAYAKAEPLAVETLKTRRGVLGDEHLDTIASMQSLAELYQLQSNYSKAEPFCVLLLETRRRKLEPQHPQVAHALALLALNHLKQEKFVEAEPLLREALLIRTNRLTDDWRTFQTQSLLGGSLAGQGKYADAEPLLLTGYEGLETRAAQIPASVRSTRLTEAIQRLITLYNAWGKPDQAAAWREKQAAVKSN